MDVAHERLQLHPGPHLQASPHGHPAFECPALGLWHPHWQVAPAQDLHEHLAKLDMICFPFNLVDSLSTK
jgi:hypothetical protein